MEEHTTRSKGDEHGMMISMSRIEVCPVDPQHAAAGLKAGGEGLMAVQIFEIALLEEGYCMIEVLVLCLSEDSGMVASFNQAGHPLYYLDPGEQSTQQVLDNLLRTRYGHRGSIEWKVQLLEAFTQKPQVEIHRTSA